jgi:uncharacterized linocin/CFP29 family protein
MGHLFRDLAPLTDEGWQQIDDEARRSLKLHLAGRRLVDFVGPLGWEHDAVGIGRVERAQSGPVDGVEARVRTVLPLVEFRAPITLKLSEIEAAARGATNLDLDAVISAARDAALAEDGSIFHGFESGGILGIASMSPHEPAAIGEDFERYPVSIAQAVGVLRAAGVGGPYAIAMGTTAYTGVIETAEGGGYPVLEHLGKILGGPIVWAPAVDGAVVLSQRGGDYELTVGQDFSVGYDSHDATEVRLYLEESFAFRVKTPEAAVALALS